MGINVHSCHLAGKIFMESLLPQNMMCFHTVCQVWSLHVSLPTDFLLQEEEKDTRKGRMNPMGIFIGLGGEAGKLALR